MTRFFGQEPDSLKQSLFYHLRLEPQHKAKKLDSIFKLYQFNDYAHSSIDFICRDLCQYDHGITTPS